MDLPVEMRNWNFKMIKMFLSSMLFDTLSANKGILKVINKNIRDLANVNFEHISRLFLLFLLLTLSK